MNVQTWKPNELRAVLNSVPPPSLLPMLEHLHYERGEERLMLAVLKDAVACIERYRYEYGVRSRAAYNDALRWIRGHDPTWLFSFENVCLGLNLDPSRLRFVLDPKPTKQA